MPISIELLIVIACVMGLSIIGGIGLGIYCLCRKKKRVKERWEPMQLVPSSPSGQIYVPKEHIVIVPRKDSKYKLIPTAQNIICIHNERAQIRNQSDLNLSSIAGPSRVPCPNLQVKLPVSTANKHIQPREQIPLPNSVLVIDGSEPPPPYQV